MPDKKLIGEVEHFFSKVKVAAVKVKGLLKIGDKIEVEGKETFQQEVTSMQINREPVEEVKEGDDVGILLEKEVKAGAKIYKL